MCYIFQESADNFDGSEILYPEDTEYEDYGLLRHDNVKFD
jgi:hypothetical protein